MVDPTDILPGGGATGAPAPRAQKLVCEFCECQLAPSGDVMRMSEKSKAYLAHDDTLAKRDKRIAELEGELSEVKRKIAELTPAQRDAFDLNLD